MDICGHHVADCFVHEPVPPYDRQSCETFRYELDGEMAVPAGSARMTGVQMAVVQDAQFQRLQRGAQPGLQSFGAAG